MKNDDLIPPLSKSKPSSSEKTTPQHIPFRSAGGASTGSFAAPRMHHFIPPSPIQMNLKPEKSLSKKAKISPRDENLSNAETSNTNMKISSDGEIRAFSQNEECNESDSVPSISKTDPEIRTCNGSDDGDHSNTSENYDGTQMHVHLPNDVKTCSSPNINIGMNTHKIEEAQEVQGDNIDYEMKDDEESEQVEKGPNEIINFETNECDQNTCNISNHQDDENKSIGMGDVDKVNASFASDFSSELEKMTLSRKGCSPESLKDHSVLKSGLLSDGSSDEKSTSNISLAKKFEFHYNPEPHVSDESDQSLPEYKEFENVNFGATKSPWGNNGNEFENVNFGATKSPWGNNGSIDSSTITSINDDRVTGLNTNRSHTQPLDQKTPDKLNTSLDSEAGLNPSPSPWNKYLEDSDHSHQLKDSSSLSQLDSGCDVSSLTNMSPATQSSVLSGFSNQSPSLQHLEYLARNSTAANITAFIPNDNTNRQRQSVPERISLQEIRELYGCKSRREAMKLSLDQSNRLSAATNVLVDLLFQYVQKHCRVKTCNLFSEDKDSSNQTGSEAKSGLSLPAAAIGWLSSHMYPDENDEIYHALWEGQDEDSCLPNASPALQVQNKLSLLKALLAKNVTHLRITGAAWPGRMNKYKKKKVNAGQTFETPRRRGKMLLNFDAHSVNSFLGYFRLLQNNPRVDMKLFPNLEYLQIEGIPPEWLHNLNTVTSQLTKMTIQRCCMRNVSILLGIQGKRKHDKSHEAIFENGIYDKILNIGTNHIMSPLVKSQVGTIDNDNCGENQLQMYPVLKHLTLSRCGIREMSSLLNTKEDSDTKPEVQIITSGRTNNLSLLEGLVTLDLSHNDIVCVKSALQGLDRAPGLCAINLSHNKLFSMIGSQLLVGNIKVLLLANNSIRNVKGLDRLYSLEKLDLRSNKISNVSDVSALAKLPQLMELNVAENPFTSNGKRRRYRIQLLALFRECRTDTRDTSLTYRDLMNLLPRLDDKDVTKKDLVMLRYLSFSHCVDNVITLQNEEVPNDNNVEEKKEDAPKHSTLAQQLIEPFEEDYRSDTVVHVVPARLGRRQVTRVVPRSDVVIHNAGLVKRPKRINKYSKVKLQKKITNDVYNTVPRLYVSLESVVQSIVPVVVEEDLPNLSTIGGDTITSVDAENTLTPESIEGSKTLRTSTSVNIDKHGGTTMNESTASIGSLAIDRIEQDNMSIGGEDTQDCDTEQSALISGMDAIETNTELNEEDDISVCPTAIIKNYDKEQPRSLATDAPADLQNEISSLSPVIPSGTDSEKLLENVSQIQVVATGNEEESCLFIENEFPSDLHDETKTLSGPDTSESDSDDDDEEDSLINVSKINFADAERSSVYDGPESYSKLLIAEYCELYFRCYVFPSTNRDDSFYLQDGQNQCPTLPQIQLYQSDRDLMMWTLRQHISDHQEIASHLRNPSEENLCIVSNENVLPCGVAATGRIQPITSDVRGSKGQILFDSTGKSYSISASRDLLFCVTNKAVYFIPEFEGCSDDIRSFPSPIPLDATFSDALWPHAYCRHPLKHLRKITFDGYGFQRLTLFFKLPALGGAVYAQPENGLMSAFDYTYVIFTCNQRHTIKLLQKIQEAAREASNSAEGSPDLVMVENDNNATSQAISRSLTMKSWSGDILLYQILHQSWPNIKDARRSFVLTNEEIFLFNETYEGDTSSCALEQDADTSRYGDISMRTICSANVQDISDVIISKDNPKLVTITIKSQSRLRWATSWLLRCYDHENAERLVENVRKAL